MTTDCGIDCTDESDGRIYIQGCVHEHAAKVVMCAFHAGIALEGGKAWCSECWPTHECPIVVKLA